MGAKFNIGDKVIINHVKGKVPKYILDVIRQNRKRTITARFYDQQSEHTRYYLGNNRLGEDISPHAFRSDELTLATKRKKGRPKIKRQYRRSNG